MNPFDHVPLDILQFVLGPFLDQETMIAFNQVTDPRERIYRRFPKDYAIKHHIGVLVAKWKDMLRKIDNYNNKGLGNNNIILRLFNDQIVPVNIIIFMHYYKFRESVINKFTDIKETSRNQKYIHISRQVLEVLEANKFVREIS